MGSSYLLPPLAEAGTTKSLCQELGTLLLQTLGREQTHRESVYTLLWSSPSHWGSCMVRLHLSGYLPAKSCSRCQRLLHKGVGLNGSIVSPDLKSQGSGKPDFASKPPFPGIDLVLRIAIHFYLHCPEWFLQPCFHRIPKHQHTY